jgi:hypothetical protein
MKTLSHDSRHPSRLRLASNLLTLTISRSSLKREPDRDSHVFYALLTHNRQVKLSVHSSGFLRLQLGIR